MSRLDFGLELDFNKADADFDAFVERARKKIQDKLEGAVTKAAGSAGRQGTSGTDDVIKRQEEKLKAYAAHLKEVRRQERELGQSGNPLEQHLKAGDATRVFDDPNLSTRQAAEAAREATRASKEAFNEQQANAEAFAKARKQIEKEFLDETKGTLDERLALYEKHNKELDSLEKAQSSKSVKKNKKDIDDLRDKQKDAVQETTKGFKARNDAVKKSAEDEKKIKDKTDQYLRQIENNAATRFAVREQKEKAARARGDEDYRFSTEQRKLLEDKLAVVRIKYAHESTEVILKEMEKVTDAFRQELASMDREASKAGGAGFGSFSNNLYQIGQAVEDFSVGFQLNGLQGGLRGASNNIAFLANQLGGNYGLAATLATTAVQVGIMAYEFNNAKDRSEDLEERLTRLRKELDHVAEAAERARKTRMEAVFDVGSQEVSDLRKSSAEDQKRRERELRQAQVREEAAKNAVNALRGVVAAEDRLTQAYNRRQEAFRALEANRDTTLTPERVRLIEEYRDAESNRADAAERYARVLKAFNENAARRGLPVLKEMRDLEQDRHKSMLGYLTATEKQQQQLAEEEVRATALRDLLKEKNEAGWETVTATKEALAEKEALDPLITYFEATADAFDAFEKAASSDAAKLEETQQLVKEIEDVRKGYLDRYLQAAEREDFEKDPQKRLNLQKETDRLLEEAVRAEERFVAQIKMAIKPQEEMALLLKKSVSLQEKAEASVKEQLKTAEAALKAEEKKLEVYEKQLQTIAQQKLAAQKTGAFGSIQAEENIQNKAIQEQIQNVHKQAEAYKKYVQAQVDYQNKLAGMFGGQQVDASGFMSMIDAQEQAYVEQLQNKQIQMQRKFNAEREKLFQDEAKRAQQAAAQAGTPEEKLKALEDAIKAQEELRQLQLSQTAEGGAFGLQKKKEYEATGAAIQKLYEQQTKAIQAAQAAAEAERQVQQQAVNELGLKLEMLNQLKADLANKDIVSELDVQRAEAIKNALTQAVVAKQFAGIAGLLGLLPEPHAKGGSFDGTRPLLVGEEGPEIIMPSSSGMVLTNDQSKSLMASVFANHLMGSQRPVNVTTNIGAVNMAAPPVTSASQLANQLRGSRYSAKLRKR